MVNNNAYYSEGDCKIGYNFFQVKKIDKNIFILGSDKQKLTGLLILN